MHDSSHVRFSPNSKFILASTQDSTIRLWNYQTSRCMKTYTGHINRTYCLFACFSTTNGNYVVSGSEDGKIYIWDLQTREVLQVLEGHRGSSFARQRTSWPNAFCGADVVLSVAVSESVRLSLGFASIDPATGRLTPHETLLRPHLWRRILQFVYGLTSERKWNLHNATPLFYFKLCSNRENPGLCFRAPSSVADDSSCHVASEADQH
jgi:hypothetical protein